MTYPSREVELEEDAREALEKARYVLFVEALIACVTLRNQQTERFLS
jgi:hypothetical protein